MSAKIAVVLPCIRPECHAKFLKAWTPLFEKHEVTLITVWDGERLKVNIQGLPAFDESELPIKWSYDYNKDLFCHFTDACRNIGFVYAAKLGADYILSLDDDVEPVTTDTHREFLSDPIQAHLDVLNKRVPISWMNTAQGDLYLRGVPYGIRDEAPVMLSHGVWVGVPDFDGETQYKLENKLYSEDGTKVYTRDLPYTLDYYKGPIPKGVLFPMCGMNVMVRKEALPYFYFAPMGPDTGIKDKKPVCYHCGGLECYTQGKCMNCDKAFYSNRDLEVSSLNRFADIWCGIFLKREFDRLGWACYTGGSIVHHTRASDAKKNMEQEKLGREWNERIEKWVAKVTDELWEVPMECSTQEYAYFRSYEEKRQRYAELIRSIQNGKS